MPDKLPHYTTTQKFSARSQVVAIADAMIRTIGRAAGEPQFAKTSAAMDATGLETTTASAHFQSRAGRTRRKWVKVSAIVLCGSLLPLSLVLTVVFFFMPYLVTGRKPASQPFSPSTFNPVGQHFHFIICLIGRFAGGLYLTTPEEVDRESFRPLNSSSRLLMDSFNGTASLVAFAADDLMVARPPAVRSVLR